MKILVGNLPVDMLEPDIKELFDAFGQVGQVELGHDRRSGQPSGYALLEMPNPREARLAVHALDGTELDGQPLLVQEAPAGIDLRTLSGGAGHHRDRGSRNGAKRGSANGK